jgi:ABC-type branched-subunit amino acid transport system substrate-binding protein
MSRAARSIGSDANTLLVIALSAAIFVLIAGAVIGARKAAPSAATAAAATNYAGAFGAPAPAAGETGASGDATPEVSTGTGTTATRPGATTVTSGTKAGTAAKGGATGGSTSAGGPNVPSQVPGTREGITTTHFKYGIHAPITLDGAPLNLAEDPITGFKGYITYLNRKGGVNGRKVKLFLADDRYTTDGGAQARDQLVKEVKPFFISGTLGVDQIAIVAKAAGEAKIPYMAGGGPEPEWKNIGMFQILASYDQYANKIVEYVCSQGAAYVGEPVRLGITTLDSPYIRPVEARFVSTLASKCGLEVDPKARGYIQKPTQQTSYTPQLLDLKGSYGGKGPNLMVPLQDPITTSRQVAEWKSQGFNPKWTFANFAHDSDTVLTLMAKSWTGVRGLSPACYYQYERAFDTSICANMKGAHDEWLALGPVTYDEDAGGNAGGKSSYTYDQASWDTDGSGGASGYHLVHVWLGAMRAIGADPTREKFVAALYTYDKYSDLITAPLTFKGSTNIMRGAEPMALIEGQSNDKWKQISVGLVDHF